MKLQPRLATPIMTRVIYHSRADQEAWEETIDQVSDAWYAIERQSVLEGIRDCCLQTYRPIEFLKVQAWAHRNGLFTEVVKVVKDFEGFATRYEPGQDRLVAAIMRDAAAAGNPEAHLGYPKCCVEAFEAHWPIVADPIWQWANGETQGVEARGQHEVMTCMLPTTNPLLRYLGVRFSPHIPCDSLCTESDALGRKMRELMDKELAAKADELLSMPITWNCYRGIAIVTIKPLRVVIGSTVTAERYIVEATL